MEKIYTPEQIAEILQLDIKTIQKWLREGKIRAKKLGREWRVPDSALHDFWNSSPDNTSRKRDHTQEQVERKN